MSSQFGIADCWHDEASTISEEQWRMLTCWLYRNALNHLYGRPEPKEHTDAKR